jgi:hypothetical protein
MYMTWKIEFPVQFITHLAVSEIPEDRSLVQQLY